MPLVPVSSLDDPALAVYRHLNQGNLTRSSGRFIAEGKWLVLRLLASDFPVESILAVEAVAEEISAAVPPEVPLYAAPKAALSELIGFRFHRGALACGRRRPRRSLAEVLPADSPRLLVPVCVEILDPENLGAILRASCAFGADAVVVSPRCADPFSRRVLRVSMGAALNVPVIEPDDLEVELNQLRETWSAELIATVLDERAEPLSSARSAPRSAILFGGEGHGLATEVWQRCDRRVTIPMLRGTDSLNVAMAAGVFLYHFTQGAGRHNS